MKTPLELWVRAYVDGVHFAPIDDVDEEQMLAAEVRTIDGRPLPGYVKEGLQRDPYAMRWTIAHLGNVAVVPTDAAKMLILLGSGSFRYFLEKTRPALLKSIVRVA